MTGRADADRFLDGPVTGVRLVSASRAKLLGKMGISTVRDLLRNYPHRYIDFTRVVSCAEAPIGQMCTVVGEVYEVVEKQPRPRMNILEVTLVDDSGMLLGVWFRQPWMARRFQRGMRVAFSGKVTFDYGFKRMNSPYVEVLAQPGAAGAGDGAASAAPTLALVPVHSTTEGLSTTWMRRLVANAVEQTTDVTDPLPPALRARRRLLSRKAALRCIHFPRTQEERDLARRRLAYEEVLDLQLEIARRRMRETLGGAPTCHVSGAAVSALRAALPFELTDEQKAAVADITADMCAPRCMNRMLLGDVGTGKTAVAAFAIALVADTGTQCAMMAPTEVLARQYAEKLGPLFDACDISWGLLTGSTGADERASLLERAASGELTCLFGTHALIEPDVVFERFTLAIIDEQHRFGVNQRSALRMKGRASDLLVMTATPIPRTLALTLYGDLDTSCLRKRPGSRPPLVTRVISRDSRGTGYDAIRAAVAAGQQAYIICPLVGLSREQRAKHAEAGDIQLTLSGHDISDPKAAEEEAAFLQAKVFPGYEVGLLTGHMANAEKRQVMADFRAGKIDVLVATTVVEVGVDVPNATVMMVEDAERFGLSQLHQLRGRVGRGSVAGQVFLVADPGKDDEQVRERLDALVATDDGFEIAEADLRTRREGDILGTSQHGAGALRLVNVIRDAELIRCAHDDARAILEGDPELQAPGHERLAREIATMFPEDPSELDPAAGG